MRIFSVYSHSSPCKIGFPHFIDEETGAQRIEVIFPSAIQLVKDKAGI